MKTEEYLFENCELGLLFSGFHNGWEALANISKIIQNIEENKRKEIKENLDVLFWCIINFGFNERLGISKECKMFMEKRAKEQGLKPRKTKDRK